MVSDASNARESTNNIVNMPTVIPPTLEPLNTKSDDMIKEWAYWQRGFERYCRLIRSSTEGEQKDIFFAFVGRETEEYLRDLPDFGDLNTMRELLDKVGSRYKRTPNVLCERFNFRKVTILPNESISEFNARLNTFSKHCKFDDYSRELAHLDQIILNCPSKLRERLLMEKDLDLAKAIDIAKFAAEGSKWANEFVPGSEREVNYTKPENKFKTNEKFSSNDNFGKQGTRKCFRCGSGKHLANSKDCPALKVTCNKCSKVGHFAKYCLIKKDVKTVSIKHEEFFNILCVDSDASTHKYIELKVNGKMIKFIIDTGSQATLLPKSIFNELNAKLLPPAAKLTDYNGNGICCLGESRVTVECGKNNFVGRVFITNKKKPLLGSDWIEELNDVNWNTYLVGAIKTESTTVDDLLNEYSEVFDLMPHHKVKNKVAHLVLKSTARPKFCLPRNVPLAIKPIVETEIEKMVEVGFWEKVSESDWATPLVPVMKADGGVRLCGDYKVTVNPQLEVAQHPLPTNEELFSKLGNSSVFSKLDMCHAFQQLELDEASREVCTVNTSRGLFRVNRLPYGVASSPAIWQRTIDSLLSGLDGVLCFIDDILICGSDLKTHNDRLRNVLKIFLDNNLHIKSSKCSFAQDSVSYLGFCVDKNGIHKTKKKVEAIKNIKIPNSVTELKSFLGLVTFYGRFVPSLSTLAAPLYQLLRKEVKFVWSTKCRDAFNSLKEELCSERFLTHYRPDLPLRLACDASATGIGAVLSHLFHDKRELPIAYASRTLQKAELNYSQIDKEALSIIFGVKHFHYYIFGRYFDLVTDHKPLLTIFGEKSELPSMVASRLQRYAVILSAYNYSIIYRASGDHGNADALSRLPVSTEEEFVVEGGTEVFSTYAVSFVKTVSPDEIGRATKSDKILSVVLKGLIDGVDMPDTAAFKPFRNVLEELNVDNGVILRGTRVVVPESLQTEVLKVLHDGHMGIAKTKSLARAHIWWAGLDKDIERLIRNCSPCQSNRNNPKKTFHMWEVPSGPWQRIHIDFAGPIDNVMYFIIVDAYSKWPEVITMRFATSFNCIVALTALFARHGIPERLVSDNGTQFVSREFSNFLVNYQISHSLTATYHPATNGEAERFVQTFKNFLKISQPKIDERDCAIQNFLLVYRTTNHSLTNRTPSEMLLQRQIRNPLSLVHPVKKEERSLMTRDGLRSFKPGNPVMVRNYIGRKKWLPGRVKEVIGQLHYLVEIDGRVMKRHVDQMRSGGAGLVSVFGDSEWCNTYDLCDLVTTEEVLLDGGRRDEEPEANGNNFIPRRSVRERKVPDRLNI